MWVSSNDWLVKISRAAKQGNLSKWSAHLTIIHPNAEHFQQFPCLILKTMREFDAFVHNIHNIQYLRVGHVSVMNRTYQLVSSHTHYDHNHVWKNQCVVKY